MLLRNPAADIGVLDAEIHLRVLLGEIGEIGAEHNAILYAASLGDSQQTLDRPNVIFSYAA